MGPDTGIVRTHHGCVLGLTARGEHDAATTPSLRSLLEPLARPGASIVVDLSQATFIDSTVLGSLVYAAENADQLTIIAAPGSHCRRVLEAAGISILATIFCPENEAERERLLLRLRAQAARRQAQQLCSGSARTSARSLEAMTSVTDRRWTPDRAERVERASLQVGRSPAIEQAKTLLATRYGLSRNSAFELLVKVSQRRNVKVRVIAEEVVSGPATSDSRPSESVA